MSFNADASLFLVSSDKATVHLFKLDMARALVPTTQQPAAPAPAQPVSQSQAAAPADQGWWGYLSTKAYDAAAVVGSAVNMSSVTAALPTIISEYFIQGAVDSALPTTGIVILRREKLSPSHADQGIYPAYMRSERIWSIRDKDICCIRGRGV